MVRLECIRCRYVQVLRWSVIGVLFLGACANPVPPRGGPEDTTPPSVVRTQPVRDTVNVATSTEHLRVEFSEYVERSSLPRSLTVTPTFERRLQFDWSGRAVEIEFPASLRDSTTYLFTFDTNLTDAHGVSLETPVTIAFSTGPKINRGQIQGRVVGGRRGEPKTQVDVYAYALPTNASNLDGALPERPSYRTQTGDDGTFAFDYMREQRYYVVALQDNNRNRKPDGLEPYATPPRFGVHADTSGTEIPVPWLFTRADTVAPRLQRVEPVTRERIRVSFDEPVALQERRPAAWVLRDSATGTSVPVRSVYSVPDRPTDVVIRTAPLRDTRYEFVLDSSAVVDSVGLAPEADTVRFGAATQPDTMGTRFEGFLPRNLPRDSLGARSLLPGVDPGVRFNQAPDSAVLREAVAVRDTSGNERGHTLSSNDGTAYSLSFEPPLAPGQMVDVTVAGTAIAGPDTTYRRRFRRMTQRSLGSLTGRVVVADTTRQRPRSPADSASATARSSPDTLSTASVAVELVPVESTVPVSPRRVVIAPGSTFAFEQLPEGRFRFRAYLDRNRNGRWDGGQVLPYVPAEPVTWLTEPVEARPRWTTELPLPLRIPVLFPQAPPAERPVRDTTQGASVPDP